MRFSSFARFGHFRFSSRPPFGRTIYLSLRASLGDDENLGEDEFSGPAAAHLFATAMGIACAQRTIDRARAEMVPHTSEEFLERHERDYGLIPKRADTHDDRRAALAQAEALSDGCSAAPLQDALEALLGDGLIAIRTHTETEYAIAPADWDTTGPGAWKPDTIVAKWHRTTAAVNPGLQTVSSASIYGDGTTFVGGDVAVIDPGILGIQERVTLTTVGATVQATFVRHHDAGAVITTEPWPFATTSSRVVLVVVTAAIAESRAWQAKIAALLRKRLRAVDTWYVVEETSPGYLGPFYPDAAVLPAGALPGIPGLTPLLAIPTVP